jgi:hypothetical protein
MPKETKTTIWVVGAPGSGKTTLITLFPLAALRLGWILIPDQNTDRYIYQWQHDLFSRGMFPPKGDAQRSGNFSFSNFKPADWEMSQLGNGRLRTQRTVTVVEHSLSSDYDNAGFEDQLKRQANINEEFGIVYCLDMNQPDESCYSHLQDIVNAFGDSKSKKTRRLCLAFTKADTLAKPDRLGEDRQRVFDDVYPWGIEADRRQQLNFVTSNILDTLERERTLGYSAISGLKQVMSGTAGDGQRSSRLETSFEICTAVGVARDQEDNYRPNIQDSDVESNEVYERSNIQDSDVESNKVYERHQLWWSGVERVFMRAHGVMPIFI